MSTQRFTAGDKAVTRRKPSIYDRNPGTVRKVWEERPGEWWVETEFTTTTYEPIDELVQWCPECKNLAGRWICSLGDEPADRILCSSRCHCPGEHEWEDCPAKCQIWAENQECERCWCFSYAGPWR